jgi:hypothetical protein
MLKKLEWVGGKFISLQWTPANTPPILIKKLWSGVASYKLPSYFMLRDLMEKIILVLSCPVKSCFLYAGPLDAPPYLVES